MDDPAAPSSDYAFGEREAEDEVFNLNSTNIQSKEDSYDNKYLRYSFFDNSSSSIPPSSILQNITIPQNITFNFENITIQNFTIPIGFNISNLTEFQVRIPSPRSTFLPEYPSEQPSFIEPQQPTVSITLSPQLVNSTLSSPTNGSSTHPTVIPTVSFRPTSAPKTRWPTLSSTNIDLVNQSYAILTWNSYLYFIFDSPTMFELAYVLNKTANTSSPRFHRGAQISRAIMDTYIQSVNQSLSAANVAYLSIFTYNTNSSTPSLPTTSPTHFTREKISLEAADATIGRTEVSTIILGNTVYLRNENASAAKRLYHSVANMSESFSASSFQSSMELNLIDVGIFNLNFTFLSTRFGSLDISMEKNFQVSPQPTGQASRSPSSIRGPSKSPISFSPVTNASIPAPTASPIVAQPVEIKSYYIAIIAVALAAIIGAGLYLCCHENKNKRKIHQMLDEAEIEDEKD